MPIGRKPRTQGSSTDVELRSILTDKAHYLKAMAHFYSQSDNALVQAWADGDFVHAVLDRINAVVGEADKLRVLAVGYGSGDLERIFWKKLCSRFSNIDQCFLETSKDLASNHQTILEDCKNGHERVDMKWQQQTIEEHWVDQKYVARGPRYHFVYAFNTGYLNPLKVTLKQLRDMLEPGGVLMINANTEDTDIGLFRKTFPALRQLEGKGDDSEVGKLSTNRNSTDVRAELNSLHIPYNLYQYTRHINLGSCFADHCPPDMSDGANLMMDFLTNCINFTKLAPLNLKSEFCNGLKEKCVQPERRDEKDQRCYFANKIDVYIVSA